MANVCAGPFGAFYDFYIDRPRLAQAIGRLVWGIDSAPLYASMDALGRLADGATVLDVPCGGGVALRGLRAGQRVRYVAVDLDEKMLARVRRRPARPGLALELVEADMRALPLPDATADLCLAYSGLHMVPDPDVAIAEIVRCLKPGGELVGTTFLSEGTRRQRLLLGHGKRQGLNGACSGTHDLRRWLDAAGIEEPTIAPDRGFAVFRGFKRSGEV